MAKKLAWFLVVAAAVASGIVLGAGRPPAGDVEIVPPDGSGKNFWPRWRGPSGQGVVEGTGYPETWSGTENVQWKVRVPGRGNSSPIVWGDKIFLTTAYDGGKRISVLCFRRSDGELLWEVFAPKATPESPHRKNGHASGTPTTDGVRVYAYLGNHGLVAVDVSGKMAWHRPLAAIPAFHGTAGSPLLYKDSVILYQDHEGGTSFVAAFDKSTGKVKWSTHRDETVGWGTPIVITTGDRDELIVSSQKRVYAYNPDTGKELWTCGGNLYEVIPTPVVGHGLVYCSSGRAGPTLAIRPGGSGDVTDTHVVWKSPKGSPFVPSPLLYGDYLYMVNDIQSVATCYDAKSGGVMWQGRLGEAQREGFSASPIGVQGKVFFTNDQGDTFVLKAGPEFELLDVNRLNQRTLASPALVDGHWYFRTESHLLSIGS